MSTTVYLAAIDATSAADHVVDVAAGLARAFGPSELHLLHVIDIQPIPAAPAIVLTDAIERGRAILDEQCARASGVFGGRVVGHIGAGEPWHEIIQRAADLDSDLIVVGTRDRSGLERLVLGSVAERVMRRAQCPVLVARRKDYNAHLDARVEPPCGECRATQRATDRARLWCDRHEAHHPKPHRHYELPEGYAAGAMFIRG